MLGRTLAQNGPESSAESVFRQAEALLLPIANERPVEFALVDGYYGMFLVSAKRWTDGKAKLELALQAGGSSLAFNTVRRQCLTALLQANRHLGKKKEVKEIQADLKQISLPAGKDEATVDLLSLQRAMH